MCGAFFNGLGGLRLRTHFQLGKFQIRADKIREVDPLLVDHQSQKIAGLE